MPQLKYRHDDPSTCLSGLFINIHWIFYLSLWIILVPEQLQRISRRRSWRKFGDRLISRRTAFAPYLVWLTLSDLLTQKRYHQYRGEWRGERYKSWRLNYRREMRFLFLGTVFSFNTCIFFCSCLDCLQLFFSLYIF